MRLPSLYAFYKAYFGYVTTGKVPFALAIKDTYIKIQEAYQTKKENILIDYKEERYARQLTTIFLNNFMALADHHYNKPMSDLIYLNNSIRIAPQNLNSKRRLDIDFGYCYDTKKRRIIFLEFGKLDDVIRWYPLFNTLISSFTLSKPLPKVEIVTCWDLLKGTTFEEEYSHIGFESIDKVMTVAKKIVNGEV